MDIGTLIRTRRKELKLTLQQVGDAVGVVKSTVKKWETGYIKEMRRDKIALLANVLQISPADLIDVPEDIKSIADDDDKLYLSLNPEDKDIVDQMIKALSSKR